LPQVSGLKACQLRFQTAQACRFCLPPVFEKLSYINGYQVALMPIATRAHITLSQTCQDHRYRITCLWGLIYVQTLVHFGAVGTLRMN